MASCPLAASLRLLVARENIVGAFPGREEIEIAKLLSELHRLVFHALLLVVPAHLHEAGEREILAQRVALEAVVGEDTAQIRMAGEQDPVEIIGLPLVPVRAAIDLDDGGHGRRLVRLDLHAYALIETRRKEVIDDVETLLAARPIHRGDVDDAGELALRRVAQVARDLDDVRGLHAQREFTARDLVARHRARKGGLDALRKRLESFAVDHRTNPGACLTLSLDRARAADLLLQQHDAVE